MSYDYTQLISLPKFFSFVTIPSFTGSLAFSILRRTRLFSFVFFRTDRPSPHFRSEHNSVSYSFFTDSAFVQILTDFVHRCTCVFYFHGNWRSTLLFILLFPRKYYAVPVKCFEILLFVFATLCCSRAFFIISRRRVIESGNECVLKINFSVPMSV